MLYQRSYALEDEISSLHKRLLQVSLQVYCVIAILSLIYCIPMQLNCKRDDIFVGNVLNRKDYVSMHHTF